MYSLTREAAEIVADVQDRKIRPSDLAQAATASMLLLALGAEGLGVITAQERQGIEIVALAFAGAAGKLNIASEEWARKTRN